MWGRLTDLRRTVSVSTTASKYPWVLTVLSRLGLARSVDSLLPSRFPLSDESVKFRDVVAGSACTAAIATNGTLFVYGENYLGQVCVCVCRLFDSDQIAVRKALL